MNSFNVLVVLFFSLFQKTLWQLASLSIFLPTTFYLPLTMKIINILFLSVGLSLTSIAQQINATTRDAINREGLYVMAATNTSLAFFDIKGPKGGVVGDSYLDSTWTLGSVKLFQKIGAPGREGDSIANVPLRLDLYTNELELKANDAKDIRAVKGTQIRFFTLESPQRRIFLNARSFRSEDNLQGFVELVAGGRISLVEFTKLNIIKPNYNEALSVGSKDTKLVKTSQYYVVKGNTLFPLTTSKKKVLDALADRADDVEKFIKTNSLNLKSRTDLAKVFEYYNNL